ncbi:N-acylglucosamine 2-epimerase [Burkholderia cenocepacia]|uniref:AGE family epimerase/isomerase n=1 Tax=Burkholderia TaxID=32008 RepID=UPI00078CABE8|nr:MULTISPECIES: AGE family epimerase/isomerase [Burkholderia]AMU07734.1 N-acylglucosamine 2-epimerase [Burkholderia cenocepacia]MDG0063861.1 AGE family epimerase/isomerase [Burkholderia sp. IO2]QUN44801.1 AGE family epimerase/isomerase [Burkholderia cenocepacia]QUO27086.1 AGE family epimerase/isomerase [Burkholderia cenocepacia]
MESSAALRDAGASLRVHYSERILPIWRGPGFNPELQLPFEAVSPRDHSPLPPARYRAMACARQLFIFSQAGDMVHAERLFDSLRRYFEDRRHGGWFYSVDINGKPKEREKDLYTHAFVIFATAEYVRRSGSREALAVLERTAELVDTRFAVGEQVPGLLNATMSEDFSGVVGTPLQNPLMHLTEAWLAAGATTGSDEFDKRLHVLATAISSTFVEPTTGCIAELPVGSAGNRLEPGHQFEWYFLAVGSAHPAFVTSGLHASLSSAFEFACRYGVDPDTGGVSAAVDEQGGVLDATQRIWAQTEYLRALAAHDSIEGEALLRRDIERFRSRFLHSQGWHECLSPRGAVVRAEMPSTTPYHLATAFAALP